MLQKNVKADHEIRQDQWDKIQICLNDVLCEKFSRMDLDYNSKNGVQYHVAVFRCGPLVRIDFKLPKKKKGGGEKEKKNAVQ